MSPNQTHFSELAFITNVFFIISVLFHNNSKREDTYFIYIHMRRFSVLIKVWTINITWCKLLNHFHVKNKTKLDHQCRKNDECINYFAIFYSILWFIFSELFTNFGGKWCLFQGNGSNWITTSATKLCRLSW